MMDDYESGLQRGRSSRHGIGKLRWLLLFSLATNAFLAYKVWIKGTMIADLQERNGNNQHKAKQTISELDMQKEKCSKLLSVSEESLKTCDSEVKDCRQNLAAVNSKLKATTDDFHNIEIEKDQVNAQLESCTGTLEAANEKIKIIELELENEKKKIAEVETEKEHLELEIQKANAVTGERKGSDDVAPIQSVHDRAENDHTGEDLGNNSMGAHDSGTGTNEPAVKCLFNEDLKEQKYCKDYDDLSSSEWKIGPASFLSDENKVCLFLDESSVPPSNFASVIFRPQISSSCIEVTVTFAAAQSGGLTIDDNGQVFEFPKSDSEWTTETFKFNQNLTEENPTHVITITGVIHAQGGVAISSLTVLETSCSPNEIVDEKSKDKDVEEVVDMV